MLRTVSARWPYGLSMIVWINGAFGVGKTTTAELLSRAVDLRPFDPEHVGYLLRAELADHEIGDVQELQPWARLVPVVADEIARFTGQDLLAVQTVLVEGRWRQLRAGLVTRGHRVVHVLLDADEATLRSRIDADALASSSACTAGATTTSRSMRPPDHGCWRQPIWWSTHACAQQMT